MTCLARQQIINGFLATELPQGRFFRCAQALRPGGRFIFDVIARGSSPMNYCNRRVGEDWAVLVEVVEQRAKRRLTYL